MGLDISKLSKIPKHTLLGLRHFPFRSIIDVGANKGQFARMISNVFPDAYIYSFEPLPASFKELCKWAEIKNKRIKVFNIALGEGESEVEMFYHSEHSPSSSLLKSTKVCESLYPITQKQTSITVKSLTLDKIIANLSDPLILDILIKLDAQGYEDRIIRGGIETFRKARACIVEVNLDELYENQATFNDILLLLHDLGYRYAGNLDQTYAVDGHVIFFDAVFLR